MPMWMFAVLRSQGDGLHGRGLDGVALLANLIFRPVLMLFGLMLGYVIFAAMSWLVMQSFGIAAGFVLAGGWLVANLLGVVVLLCLFVLTEVTLALLSFRMISLVPHHAIQLMAIKPANRVDMDRFAQDLGLVGMAGTMQRFDPGQSRSWHAPMRPGRFLVSRQLCLPLPRRTAQTPP